MRWGRRLLSVIVVPLCLVAAQPHRPWTEQGELKLPVGDGRWTVDGPRKGWVYVCKPYAAAMRAAQRPTGGVAPRQPWFSEDGQWYYPDRKPTVSGDQHHHGALSVDEHAGAREVRTNSLPVRDGTGVFPIAPSDPAYLFDRNPNTIAAADLIYRLPRTPVVGRGTCISNQVGVLLSGPVLLSPLDAAGRDPGAWEVVDACAGHPESGGLYHFHTPSTCGGAGQPEDQILGWALDGHPITGAITKRGRRLTTADLDECHGRTASVRTPAGLREVYHYVLTQDFPYSVACFRGGTPAS